jgi:glutamate---cysteine ligase / carboxylate-amine ligase
VKQAPPPPDSLPEWSAWTAGERDEFTVGVEEEAMLLDLTTWALAHRIESVLPRIPADAIEQTSAETHGSAVEVQTAIHDSVADAIEELRGLRRQLSETLEPLNMRAATSGTHPFAVWQETVVSTGERYDFVQGSMRALARREPTFALHVHVGVEDPERAIRAFNAMRVHLPLLLALSANSPYWQGRDTGLASARTPLWQGFFRVGIPRAYPDYDAYVASVDLLVRTEAIPDPTFLWWDIRPQPRLGTIEIRVMDAQTRLEDAAALVALARCLTRLEVTEGWAGDAAIGAVEAIDENRFLAARDGNRAELIDVEGETRIAVADLVDVLVEHCLPHAQEMGCEAELEGVRDLVREGGCDRQRAHGGEASELRGLVGWLADEFG